MTGVKYDSKPTEAEIYEAAKRMGMDFPDNFKVINSKEVGK